MFPVATPVPPSYDLFPSSAQPSANLPAFVATGTGSGTDRLEHVLVPVQPALKESIRGGGGGCTAQGSVHFNFCHSAVIAIFLPYGSLQHIGGNHIKIIWQCKTLAVKNISSTKFWFFKKAVKPVLSLHVQIFSCFVSSLKYSFKHCGTLQVLTE